MSEVDKTNTQPSSNPSTVYDDGLLWSFLRDTMIRGTHISADTREKPYEEFSARLDVAALEQVDRLKKLLAQLSGESSAVETVCDHWVHCPSCGEGLRVTRNSPSKIPKVSPSAEKASEGEVTVVTNEAGDCVAVTRTDSEHRILKVIWERQP